LLPVVDTTINGNYMKLLNANSYQKGGWVLHMLRRKLGDDLFWKGIRNYYAQYKDKNANTDDLRLVMEQASGVDLKQFFKQWLYTAGHPVLQIEKVYDKPSKTLTLTITQKQEELYEFPLEFVLDGRAGIMKIKDREVTVKLSASSDELVFDPNVNLLATIKVSK
jgi:aminopeptidase N